MADSSEIEKLLAQIRPEPWASTVYRVMLGDAPPDRENTRGARWNTPQLAAIYTSLTAEAAIAEVEYGLSKQSRPIRPDLRRTLYHLDVGLRAVADLNLILADLNALGISDAELFRDDMRASQEIGRSVAWLGFDGLLVPSARSEGLNLVIYPSRVQTELFRFEVKSQTVLT